MIEFYRDFCAQDKYMYANGQDNLITVYDDNVFDRSDFDVLNGPQRQYLVHQLVDQGHRQISGKKLQNIEHGFELEFCQSPSLGVSPMVQLERCYTPNKMWMVTPTTFALFLFSKNASDCVARVEDLIQTCPVNFKKMIDVSRHDAYHHAIMKASKHLQAFQKDVIAQKFARQKPIG